MRAAPFSAEDLADALDETLDERFSLRFGYSGRGMLGDRCFGIVHAPREAVRVGVALVRAVLEGGDDEVSACAVAAALARSACADDMGRAQVTYFPGWALEGSAAARNSEIDAADEDD